MVGRPQLDLVEREAETLRHDADHGVGLVVQHDLAAHEPRVAAEEALPGLVLHHAHERRTLRVVDAHDEAAPDRRPNADDVEEAVGDEAGADALRLGAAGKVGALGDERGESLEEPRLPQQVLKVGHREVLGAGVLVEAYDLQQLVGSW